MPVATIRTSLGASSTANVLAGTQYEFLPYDAAISIAIQADATGVLGTVSSGTDSLMEEGPVQLGTINVQPKYPDDFYLQDVAGAGEKISVKLRDTSGAARTVMTVVRIDPL